MQPAPSSKTCPKCDLNKSTTGFSRNRARADGLFLWCKSCQQQYDREYRVANPRPPEDPEKHKLRGKAYREAGGDALREKERLRQAAYVERNREAVKARLRNWGLLRKYGITTEQWEAMFDTQGRACAVCRDTEPGAKYWHTDHCHTTGDVRGILCHHCNLALAHVKDSVEILQSLQTYLIRTPLAVSPAVPP